MGRSSGKCHKQSRYRHVPPLLSTRREDGLWQSIERDEEDLVSCFEEHRIVSVDFSSLAAKESDLTGQHTTHGHYQPRQHDPATTATPHTPDRHSTPKATPSNTSQQSPNRRLTTPTRADLLARVLNCPLPHPGLPTPEDLSADISQPVLPSPGKAQRGPKRRRGRPRKPHNAPNWNKRRRVRFSDPIPAEPEPRAESQDPHIFVRLLKITVSLESSFPAQRQELIWNNRAKGWRLAGERSEQNIGDIAELLNDISRHGSMLKVLLAPTERRGAREPVEMAWNATMYCFQGSSQDLGSLSVALGEMKDMVKDPWARQFVGCVS